MIIITWILAGILAAINILAGATKVFSSWESLSEKMPYTATVGQTLTRLAGWAELVGAVGVIVPNILAQTVSGWEWALWVSFSAAIGLGAIHIIAIGVHAARKEPFVINIGFIAISAVTAVFIALT